MISALLVSGLLAAAPDGGALAERWTAAVAEVPELQAYRPLDLEPLPRARLQAWAPDGGEATVFDANCAPVRVERGEVGLRGTAEEKVSIRGASKRVVGTEMEYAAQVSNLGSGSSEYRRAGGAWELVGQSGTGDLAVEPGVLERVDADVARWTGALVAVRVICEARVERVSSCGGADRVCSACARLGLEVHSQTMGVGFGRMPGTTARSRDPDPAACARACPRDELGDALAPLNDLLGRRQLLAPGVVPEGPVLYRTRAACRAARKSRR